MGDFIDLSKYLQDNGIGPLDRINSDGVDLSGKPVPVNVRVQLDSGVIVKCDVRYKGVNPADGDRMFTVIAEIDWENYKPKLIIVEEMPNDVEFRLKVAGLPDELDAEFCSGIQLVPERIVKVR